LIIFRLLRVVHLPALLLVLFWNSMVAAAEPAVQSVTVTERGRDLLLSADVSLNLNSQLEDAVSRGLPLYFSVEVEIRRPRWYWFDEVVLSSTQSWRIVHNPLTRQWRVHTGNLALPVGSLAEALSVVRHVRNWRIGDRDQLRAEERYAGRLRVRFDISQLSKPFQVNALNSSDWSLATPWTEFEVRIGKEASAPANAAPAPSPQPGLPPPPVPPPGPGGASPTTAPGQAAPSSYPQESATAPARPSPAPHPSNDSPRPGHSGNADAPGGHGLALPGAASGHRPGVGLSPPAESP